VRRVLLWIGGAIFLAAVAASLAMPMNFARPPDPPPGMELRLVMPHELRAETLMRTNWFECNEGQAVVVMVVKVDVPGAFGATEHRFPLRYKMLLSRSGRSAKVQPGMTFGMMNTDGVASDGTGIGGSLAVNIVAATNESVTVDVEAGWDNDDHTKGSISRCITIQIGALVHESLSDTATFEASFTSPLQ